MTRRVSGVGGNGWNQRCCASSDILKEKKKIGVKDTLLGFQLFQKPQENRYIYIGFYQRTGGYVICRGVGDLLFSILFEDRGYIRTGSLIC